MAARQVVDVADESPVDDLGDELLDGRLQRGGDVKLGDEPLVGEASKGAPVGSPRNSPAQAARGFLRT